MHSRSAQNAHLINLAIAWIWYRKCHIFSFKKVLFISCEDEMLHVTYSRFKRLLQWIEINYMWVNTKQIYAVYVALSGWLKTNTSTNMHTSPWWVTPRLTFDVRFENWGCSPRVRNRKPAKTVSYFKALKTLEFLTIDMLYIKVFLRGLSEAAPNYSIQPTKRWGKWKFVISTIYTQYKIR